MEWRRQPFRTQSRPRRSVTAFTLLALMALAIGIVVAYRVGASHGRRNPSSMAIPNQQPLSGGNTPGDSAPEAMPQLLDFAEDRRSLLREVANARGEIARYRQIVIDIERNAPPPLLDAPGTPDDLKLIVGIGPVI